MHVSRGSPTVPARYTQCGCSIHRQIDIVHPPLDQDASGALHAIGGSKGFAAHASERGDALAEPMLLAKVLNRHAAARRQYCASGAFRFEIIKRISASRLEACVS
jgi:hypothetical protein